MKIDPENPFSELNKSDPNTIQTYFAVESDHMPSLGYSKKPAMVSCRLLASCYIKKYAASGARDPVIPFLALSYFDNYSSSTEVPEIFKEQENRARLLTTSCFVSAWRMRSPDFSLNKFRIRQNLDFNMEEVVEIEALIDQCLHARKCKRPVTALCFLDYLIGTLPDLDEYKVKCLKSFATHKLYALQYDMRLTKFRPSIIAAAALVSCLHTFYKHVHRDIIPKLFKCKYLNAVNLKRAIKMLVPTVAIKFSNSAEPKLMRPPPDRRPVSKRRLPRADRHPVRKRRLPLADRSAAPKRRIIADNKEKRKLIEEQSDLDYFLAI